uniref:receptor protein-tyrosine kinase n=2 Tax=Clastoptera arizonana TaxID=38151 RepID=A0A1B6E4F9_9HEMI
MKNIWILVFIFSTVELIVIGQYSDNTPPIMSLNREWKIDDTEPIGTVVTRARAEDLENDPLEFGIEKGRLGFDDGKPVPFRIDNTTGVVYTNESLISRSGQELFLYVSVNDGKLTQKTEVRVIIKNTTALDSSRKPSKIPNLSNFNFPPQYHRPSLPGSVNNNGINYPYNIFNSPYRPQPPPIQKYPQTLYNTNITSKSKSETEQEESTIPATTKITPTTSKEFPDKPTTLSPTTISSPIIATDLLLTIIPLIMVLFIFLFSGLVACFFRKKICKTLGKKSKKSYLTKKSSSDVVQEEPMAMQQWRGPRAFSNRYEPWDSESSQSEINKPGDKWEFPRHRLKVFNILGEGCFGQVWKCEALDIDGHEGPIVVAVKTLKENAGERERSDLLQELQVMKMLEPHQNVVRLLGCCTEKDPLFVIMEFISLGKLQSFLRNSRAQRSYDNMHAKSGTLTSRDLTSFCYQVARGMEFLSSKGIIHRDLAARNVLIGENQICKVADFGFARDVITSHVYERKSEGRLPIRWMAPESLYDNIFSVKSDIWSFGVLIWEIVTLGSTPYPGLAAADVMRRVREGYRLDKPEHCRRELYNIMYYCWDSDPKERPNFTELVEFLEQLLLTETEYIELDRFPDHSYYNMVSLSGEKL